LRRGALPTLHCRAHTTPWLTPHLCAICGVVAQSGVLFQVRRGALLTLNCLAHNRPATIRDALSGGELLPMLYAETAKKPELVHQVDLGPFKHTVDDGLENRKAAFECMDTLLETSFERLELVAFLSHLAKHRVFVCSAQIQTPSTTRPDTCPSTKLRHT
jgi:hypothetical protein